MLNVTDHGPVRELRLDRPPANALNPALVERLTEAVRAAPGDGARALVLSGRAGMFSAGLDVPELLTLDREGIRHAWLCLVEAMRALATSPVPVVAAITGHSPAGGAVLALFCDYRVMAAGPFRIGLNEVQVGIPLPRWIFEAACLTVGWRQAERLSVGGLLIEAREALDVGLVDELTAPEGVVERALAWCRERLELPPRAMAGTRSMARARLARAVAEFGPADLDEIVDAWFSKETQATLKALARRLAAPRGAGDS